jgi:hypothetical protein
MIINFLTAIFLGFMMANFANAGDVTLLAVEFEEKLNHQWEVKATLKHTDEDTTHYADAFQVEDEAGNVLGVRVLQHPHIEEQPFTRALAGVHIPKNSTIVYVKAHDKVHGWGKQGLKVDLTQVNKGYLRVEKKLNTIVSFKTEDFQQGALIDGRLISWLNKNAGSMRIQMPVNLTTSSIGDVTLAYLRTHQNKIKIHLNTQAMPMKLYAQLKTYCPSHPCNIRLWLEGTWGALVSSPLNRKRRPIFSVFSLVGLATAEERNIRVPDLIKKALISTKNSLN